MNMWNRRLDFLVILWSLVALACGIESARAQTYQFTCTVQNQYVSGSDFYYDLYIQNTHASQSIYLGNCDLTQTFSAGNFSSATALNTQLGATNSRLENYYSSDVNIYTSGTSTIIVFNLLPPSPTQTNFGTRVEEVPANQSAPGTYIATIKVSTISNSSGTMDLQWRSSTPYNTIVSTFQTYNTQVDITSSGSYTNPTNSPLPVELISFSAYNQEDHVHLHWETATELNNFGFEVQRMEEGGEWKPVGFVAGKGTVFYPQIYDWDDWLDNLDVPLSQQQLLRYRLKQMDRDGSYEYSPVVDVAFTPLTGPLSLEIYPSPCTDRAVASLRLSGEAPVTAGVFDVTGKQLITVLEGATLAAGNHAVTLPVQTLPPGVYLLRVSAPTGTATKRFIVGR